MRWTLILPILIFYIVGCGNQKKEQELQKWETALHEKEQELLLKEKTLQLKEEDLAKRELHLDSTAIIDSAQLVNPTLVGSWSVKMTCTETTCAGSAVGDNKTEVWDISYENATLIAKATADEKLIRIYTGSSKGNEVELTQDKASIVSQPAVKMLVRLSVLDSTHMEGKREIVRDNDCKVVYTVQMQKQ